MCTGRFLKPTKRPVYVQKKSTATKAKVVKAAAVSPVIVRADSDSESDARDQYQYVIRRKPSGNKNKHGDCAGANCKKGGAKNPGPNKAHIIVRNDTGKRCVCNGRGKDLWLCDACRGAQKKKGILKVFPAPSTSDGGSCCCSGCASEDSTARFKKEVDAWMKESKQKMQAKNGKLVCHCSRSGCKVCVFVQK